MSKLLETRKSSATLANRKYVELTYMLNITHVSHLFFLT
jgi:hypothetical protein